MAFCATLGTVVSGGHTYSAWVLDTVNDPLVGAGCYGGVLLEQAEFVSVSTSPALAFTADQVGVLQTLAANPPTNSQFTAQEVTALKYMAANPSPFNLSVEDGGLVAAAVVGVWLVAWASKALITTLKNDGLPTE